MKFLSAVVLTAIVSAVAAGGKKFGQLKEEIAAIANRLNANFQKLHFIVPTLLSLIKKLK